MKYFRSYLQRHRILWIILFLFSCLCHGTMLLSPTSGIDVDVALNGTAKNGLDLGRQGFFLLHYALNNGWFNPYYVGALTLVFLTCSVILWSYLYVRATDKEHTHAILASGLLFLSSSTLTMQLFFKSQALETSFGFCLMAVTILTLMKTLEKDAMPKRLWKLGLLLIPTVILFSTYQVFYVIFIYGVVAYLFLRFQNLHFVEHTNDKERWSLVLWSGGFFLVGFIINRIITAFIVHGEGYLTGQILWGKEPLSKIFWLIGKSIVGCLIGYQPYFTWTLLVFYLMILVACVRLVIREKSVSSKILIILVTIGLLVAHFAITIVMGIAPALRSQLVYPLLLGFFGFYVFTYYSNRKVVSVLLQVCCLICLVSQFSATQRLNYTDTKRYERDLEIAYAIQRDIDAESQNISVPVAFYGHLETSLNDSCMIVSEPISTSVFDWDWSLNPKYYNSTVRILDFMNAQGNDYRPADEAFFYDFVPKAAADMPCYPEEGSVRFQNGIVIVKLSEDMEYK